MVDAQKLAMQTCIDMVPQKVSPEQKGICNQDLNLTKLIEALMEMVDDKSPGLDSFRFPIKI
jgi:hypothetical protein